MLIAPVTLAALWRRGQEGWPRCFPIVQFPNAPLLVAFAGWGLAAVTDGTANDMGRAAFVAGLGVWALLELVAGVNWFRRLVGAAALVWIVVALADKL